MTELIWKNEEDRLSIIKNGMLNNLFYTDNSARLWRNKYLPWLISRVEELEKERYAILSGQRQVYTITQGGKIQRSDIVEDFIKAIEDDQD
jgi:hypothetical protein